MPRQANGGRLQKSQRAAHLPLIFLRSVLPNEAARIEPIMPDLFVLNNEFWISFWADEVMYDKRFVFEANTIDPKKFVEIPQLKAKGIVLE